MGNLNRGNADYRTENMLVAEPTQASNPVTVTNMDSQAMRAGRPAETVDCNNLITPGSYRVNQDALNIPAPSIYAVCVFGDGINLITQVASDYLGAGIWTRTHNSAIWSPWVQYGAMTFDGTTLNITL